MKTPAILNPPGIAPNQAPRAAQPSESATGTPFRQVLTREVAERRDAEKPDAKQNRADKSPEDIAGDAKAQAPDTTESSGVEVLKAAPSPGDAAGTQMLALVAQFAQFNSSAAEISGGVSARPDAGKHPFAAEMESGILRSGEPTKNLPAMDLSAAVGDGDAAADQAADFEQQLGLAAGKPAMSTLQAHAPVIHETPEVQPGTATAAVAPAQQAAGQMQVAAGSPGDKLMPRVGANGWDQALGQRMVWMVNGAQQSASLTLNPPDLGPLQVVLNISNAQATANFIAAQPEVRQALEAAMPRLREMLEDAGIQLGQSSVSAGTPQQHGAFGEQRQGSGSLGHAEDADATTIRTGQGSVTVRQGLVDTFA